MPNGPWDNFKKQGSTQAGPWNDFIAPPPTLEELKATHAENQAIEAANYNESLRGTARDAAILRGAGGFASMIPGAGPFLAGGADIAAQMVEKAGGQRQTYNPIRTAAEAGLSMIPGAPIGKLAKPTIGLLPNLGRGALIAGAHAAEGAARGAGGVAASSLAEGEIPTSEQIKAGAGAGVAFSPLASALNIRQMRRSTQQATAAYNAAGHIAKAISLPTKAEHGAENLQQGVGLALTHGKALGEKVETVKDLARVAEDARQTFGTAHLDPLKKAFGGQVINPSPILNQALTGLKSIHYEADPTLQKRLEPAMEILSRPRTAADLLEYYHTIESEIRPFQKATAAERAQKFGDAEWRFKLRLKEVLQDTLADHFDQARALQEGRTVGALRAAGEGFKTIHRQYGSLAFISNLAKQADTQLDNIRMGQAGELVGAGEAAEKILAPIFLSRRRLAGQALDMVIGGRNDPDNLVRKASKVFSKYGTPSRFPATMKQPPTQPPTGGSPPGGGGGGGAPPGGGRPSGGNPPGGGALPPRTQLYSDTIEGEVPITISPMPSLQPGFRNPNLSPEVRELSRGRAAEQSLAKRTGGKPPYDPLEELQRKSTEDWMDQNMGMSEAADILRRNRKKP